MPKVVLSGCFGGFRLSGKAKELYKKKSGKEFNSWEIKRTCPFLIETIKELGAKEASGFCANLYFEEISQDAIDTNAWKIDEYDGSENIKINYEAIDLYKEKNKKDKIKNNLSEFLKFTLNVINDIDTTDEEKIRALKEAMVVKNILITDPFTILAEVTNNIKYVPKFGTEYKKAATDFADLLI
jgi:hypothetical protein